MAEQIRVGIALYGDPDQVSGGYLYDRALANYLTGKGCSVEFLSVKQGSYVSSAAPSRARELSRSIQRGKPFDVIIIDELCHPSVAFHIGQLRSASQCPIILLVHHLKRNENVGIGTRFLAIVFERNVVRGVDGFIYNSTSTRNEVGKLLGKRSPLSGIIAHPAGNRLNETAIQAARKLAHRSPISDGLEVLFVGNIIPRKGLHVLLESLEILSQTHRDFPAIQLTVAGGDASDTYYAYRMVRKAKKARSLFTTEFTGRVSDTDLAKLYAKNHILCVPSSFEGFGIVYLEAMHFGMPAIGTAQGGACDVIVDGENGFLVPAGNARILADRLFDLAHCSETYRRMSDSALQTASTAPSWDESMDLIFQYLISLNAR